MSAKFLESPTRKLFLKSGIQIEIRIETTENIFLDAENAFLAAREDTKLSMTRGGWCALLCYVSRMFAPQGWTRT